MCDETIREKLARSFGYEEYAAILIAKLKRTKGQKSRLSLQNELDVVGIADLALYTAQEIQQVLERGKMVEHRRRQPEIELLIEASLDQMHSLPPEYFSKSAAIRFFELIRDTHQWALASTGIFHPVMFRNDLNTGWHTLGRAAEVAYAIELTHEAAAIGGARGITRSSKELRAALLAGTTTGTIEQIAERHLVSPRNVSFSKAWARRQAK